MAIVFIKFALRDSNHLRHFTKHKSSLCSLHEKIKIQINKTAFTSKEKN